MAVTLEELAEAQSNVMAAIDEYVKACGGNPRTCNAHEGCVHAGINEAISRFLAIFARCVVRIPVEEAVETPNRGAN